MVVTIILFLEKMLQLQNFWKNIWAKSLYHDVNLSFGKSIHAIVWPNWSEKSTIIKLLTKQIVPQEWNISSNSSFKFWIFNQSHSDLLNSENSFEYIKKQCKWKYFKWINF